MENKKTTELLDRIWELSKKDDFDDEYTEILDELKSREPFRTFVRDENDEEIVDILGEIKDDVKLLKRHKHDEKNGDVLVRI